MVICSESRPRHGGLGAAVDDAEDMFVSRFRRLTSREVRVLILVVQDRPSYRELGEALGVTRGSIANTMASIRRKLVVPIHEDLAGFVGRVPSLSACLASPEATAPAWTAEETRRRKDVLRITIGELESVAIRARRRASALETLPATQDEAVIREEEVAMARRVAEHVEVTVAHVLAEARGDNRSITASACRCR